MAITHVVRGEEHVNGTPKYLCLGDALGLDYRPVFAHLPVLVNEKRQKLSKRRDSVSVQERSEEHTSELQSLMRISSAVFCLKQKKEKLNKQHKTYNYKH